MIFFFNLFQAILVGDFILSTASMALARIGNITVVKVLSQVIEDLVRGTGTIPRNCSIFEITKHKNTSICT